jgi:hypothetical protein
MESSSYDNDDQGELYGLHGAAPSSDAPVMSIYMASRNEVVAGDVDGVRQVVEHHLLRTPATARRAFQSLMFSIQDYDEDSRELYHVPDCRAWF